MQKSEKDLVLGIVIGATLATTAIVYTYKKISAIITESLLTIANEPHLFDLNGQEGKEDLIDSLIPKEKATDTKGEAKDATPAADEG